MVVRQFSICHGANNINLRMIRTSFLGRVQLDRCSIIHVKSLGSSVSKSKTLMTD